MTAHDLARAEAIRRRMDAQADSIAILAAGARRASDAVARRIARLAASEVRP